MMEIVTQEGKWTSSSTGTGTCISTSKNNGSSRIGIIISSSSSSNRSIVVVRIERAGGGGRVAAPLITPMILPHIGPCKDFRR